MDRTSVTVVLLLAGAWLLQIFLSSRQMARFHRKTQQWRREGAGMAIGLAGTTYRRKTYGVVVVDEDWNVVKAGRLSGFTVAAGLKTVDEAVGLTVDQVGRGEPPEGVSPKTWAALDHAAEFLRKKRNQDAVEVESIDEGGDAMT
ncbi:MAG TPA: transcriptional regulator GutM [Acidimicrobiia bacterium]